MSFRGQEEEKIAQINSPYFGSFDKLWTERTIEIPPIGAGGGLLLPFSGNGEPSIFPLTIRATYMDSAVINSGFHEFVRLTAMTDKEAAIFKDTYWNKHTTGDTLFIWAEMRTTSTVEFLDLHRWTIFLENDEGYQFEPARIVEHQLEQTNKPFFPPGNRYQERPPGTQEIRYGSSMKKNVELYFPIHRFGDSIFSPRTTHLKFVILETEHPLVRAESSWILSILK